MMIKTFLFSMLIGILVVQPVSAQIDHSKYFEVSTEDLTRWKSYTNFLNHTILPPNQIADSIMNFAQIEYQQEQFSKTRELCLIAKEYHPELSSSYLLIGKAYVSNAKICHEGNFHSIAEDIIWVAIDEWEKIDSDSKDYLESRKLIKRYSSFLPTEEKFRNYFGKRKLNEGGEYFVSCWVNRKTKVRFKKE